jgi:NAD(P)-dependent dehydrogenase (short-subunit alcohol dehydrogenase family)
MEISNRAFIVTGAASGLGEATARLIVHRGGSVIIADTSPAGAALAKELGPAAHFVPTDVTSEADGLRAVDAAKEKFGALHGLVNCAGIAPGERIAGRNGPHSLETFTRAITINLIGTFNMLRLAAVAMTSNKPMADGERGVIVNTASVRPGRLRSLQGRSRRSHASRRARARPLRHSRCHHRSRSLHDPHDGWLFA